MVTCRMDNNSKTRPALADNRRDVLRPSYVIAKRFRPKNGVGKTVNFLLTNPDSTLLYEVDKTQGGDKEAYRHAKGHRTVRVKVNGKTRRKEDNDTSDDDQPDQDP